MIEPELIAKSMDGRDAFKVVAYREVGLPVFRLNCLMTLQDSGPIGPIEEFILRSVSKDVASSAELEAFLGLPPKVVSSQLGQLVYEGTISQVETAPPRYGLTRVGRAKLEAVQSSRMIREQVRIHVDGITRKVIDVSPHDTYTKDQMVHLSHAVLPPVPRQSPQLAEVDLADVNRLFAAESEDGRPTRRAVRVDGFVGRNRLVFRRAVAVAYKSDDGRQMAIAFAVDGRASELHEIQYSRSEDGKRSKIFGTLFDADLRRRDVQAVVRELRADVPKIFTRPDKTAPDGRKTLGIRGRGGLAQLSAQGNVRILSVYDHPPLLAKAFEIAKSRLLIVSPWIRANVVTAEFIQRLAKCLARGVEITIAYGIGRRDSQETPQDIQAREALEAVARANTRFRFVRRGNTHAKVLLVDDKYFVTTSFNWLSFRGDPRQPMREEEGTLVEQPDLVDGYYETLLQRIEAAR